MNKIESVFIVGSSDIESNIVDSIHITYDGALKSWNEIRLKLLNRAKHMKELGYKDYEAEITNLLCEDPTKMNNGMNESPYIKEMKLEE